MKLQDLPKPFIIADVGSNWYNSPNESDNLIMAKRHIYDAQKCGVNAVKFQLFTNEELYGMSSPKPNQYSLPRSWIPELAAYCSQVGVEFMCTAFSPEGYQFIDPFVNYHKVASSEMKYLAAYRVLVGMKKPILISTGGAHESELFWLSELLQKERLQPGIDFGFLQCIAAYPAKEEDYNLNVLKRNGYVGVSDHTKTNVVALTSVGLGVIIFEKHFASVLPTWGIDPIKVDYKMHGHMGPDIPVSIPPYEMTQYVQDIKKAFSALGHGRKMALPSERDMTMRHRRRLKVTAEIKTGDVLEYGKNFGAYRSIAEDGEAAGPEAEATFAGARAKKDMKPGDPVWFSGFDCGTPR